MKKIIHLSDVHIGWRDLGDRFQCLLGNLMFLKRPPKDYVIVITGDIVDNAFDESNFAQARLHIERLTTRGYQVLVAPGNHDYGMGSLADKKYVQIFKQTFFGDPNVTYPKVDIVDGEMAFMALDSMAEELHWHDRLFAEGELGETQLVRLEKILRSEEVKNCKKRIVYLHHHPFDPLPFHQLKDSDRLGEILEGSRNVDALLYGHNHQGKIRNGVWGIPRCYDAGSTTGKGGLLGPHRIIDLTREPRMDYDGNFHCAYEEPSPQPDWRGRR